MDSASGSPMTPGTPATQRRLSISSDSESTVTRVEDIPQSSSGKAQPLPPQKHPIFYIDDGNVVLQADSDETLYRVHRYFLTRESVFFEQLLAHPYGQLAEGEGESDEQPIILPETTAFELDNILRLIYFGMHDDYRASLQVWSAVLSVSARFSFDRIRQRCIKELSSRQSMMDPIDQIVLSFKHDIPSWLVPAYVAAVRRTRPLTLSEASRIPLHTVMLLTRSREIYWNRDNMPCTNCSYVHSGRGTHGVGGFASPAGPGGVKRVERAWWGADDNVTPHRSAEEIVAEQIRIMGSVMT